MKILVADNEDHWCTGLSEFCRKAGHEVLAVSDGKPILKMKDDKLRTFKLALLDYKMPTDGLKTGEHLIRTVPGITVVMLTVHADTLIPEKVVTAMRAGFYDYLDKNGDYETALARILRIAADRDDISQQGITNYTLDQIIGDSPRMVELRQLIQTVAVAPATVLILGESGVGKELVAGAIHSLSARREAPYVRLNCAAIPENLLESELFGHEKGAFTGALKQKLGRVEEADGGTVFLDEIGDMSRPLQAKLLRFLEDGSFTRVGRNDELRVDVRLIAATNRDIIEAIRQNQFREDLFHRLNVVQLRPPPLRERDQDVLQLARFFLNKFANSMKKQIGNFTPAAQQVLGNHSWPGNVRELRNAIERAVIVEETNVIQAESLPNFQYARSLQNPYTRPVTALQGHRQSAPEHSFAADAASYEIDPHKLTELCQEIWKSRNSSGAISPEAIVEKHGAPYLKAILAVFTVKLYDNGQEDTFNEVFGLKSGKRASVGLRQFLQQCTRNWPNSFQPRPGNSNYGVTDLRDYAHKLKCMACFAT